MQLFVVVYFDPKNDLPGDMSKKNSFDIKYSNLQENHEDHLVFHKLND